MTLTAPLSSVTWTIHTFTSSCESLSAPKFTQYTLHAASPGKGAGASVSFDTIAEANRNSIEIRAMAVCARWVSEDDHYFQEKESLVEMYLLLLRCVGRNRYERVGAGYIRWVSTEAGMRRIRDLEQTEIILI
jgi:hypothetical protein